MDVEAEWRVTCSCTDESVSVCSAAAKSKYLPAPIRVNSPSMSPLSLTCSDTARLQLRLVPPSPRSSQSLPQTQSQQSSSLLLPKRRRHLMPPETGLVLEGRNDVCATLHEGSLSLSLFSMSFANFSFVVDASATADVTESASFAVAVATLL